MYCESKTQVTNSRMNKRTPGVWRRRACQGCDGLFTTYEAPDFSTSLSVVRGKKDREAFSRDKLFISVYESCKHRPTAFADAGALTQTIISKLIPAATHGSLTTATIALISHDILGRFDKVASTVYHAYHPSMPVSL